MYGWGDDTNTWKNPGAYDFGSARRSYLEGLAKSAEAKGPRTYTKGKKPDLKLVDPKNKEISSDSENPIIIAVDGTGSMQHYPAEIFDRLPLLYQTLSKYKPDVEISFSVIGDAVSDQWPVQVSNFGKGPTLDDYLKALVPEGGGGPGIRENYELWAYFMHENAKTPKATSPFMIIMGDEKFYETIKPELVKKYIGVDLAQSMDAKTVWKNLSQRFNIYFLRKPYEGHDKEIVAQWGEAIGEQKIIPVYDATRVVDVAMGLIAKSWGNFDDFKTNLSARQDADGIKKVMTSLRAAPGVDKDLKSKVKSTVLGKKSKGLVEGLEG